MSSINVWKTSLAVVAISFALTAQQVPNHAAFEVVSIKPANPAASGHTAQLMPGEFRGRNLRLFELIMSAWHLNRDQIVGGPPWLQTAGWDIDALLPTGVGAAQAPQMMQSMLADRFALVVHRETRTLPVYDLTVAKSGIKLRERDGRVGMSAGPRLIRYGSGTMAELARQLSGYLGRQVIDRTGLTGQYAISLSFAPVDPGVAGGDTSQDSRPSIFQALQQQAGLKLESAKGPVEILVIDHAEMPMLN